MASTTNDIDDKNVSPSLEILARYLLKERLILTALELHTESTEAGQEIPLLKDYFSNPSNFELCSKTPADFASPSANLNRSSSQTTLDSLDWARYSEDGERALDDKIAVLEFELRKAKETIQGLRDNLTQATASSSDPENTSLLGNRKYSTEGLSGDLKPHEVCALNFLVNEYLVMRNYKMTANTFADENDNQDFEHWDDVGLNIPRPPTLIQWLQEKVPGITPKLEVSCQTDIDGPQMDSFKIITNEKLLLEDRVKELESLCERQELELQKLHRKISSHITAVGIHPDKNDKNDTDDNFDFTDTTDKIELEKSSVKYAKKTDCNKLDNTTNPFESTYVGSIIEETNGLTHENEMDFGKVDEMIEYINDINVDDIGSIEDLIENPARNDDGITCNNLEEPLSTMKSLEFHDDFEGGKESSVVDTPTDADTEFEEQDTQELFSEASEVLDPRKCDRLPPLGASSECSPQGVLAGEFISAQREEAKNLLQSSSMRDVPQFFETQILNVCFGQTLGVDSRLQNEVAALSLGQCDLLNLVASSLHNIAPNVILSKREELLPLLVYSISQHADSKERERLLHLLFNLTKKPDKEQRSTILLGLVSLARVLGSDKLEAELLPQCWEQLSHKHTERRLLVAQSVAVLAPYTPPPLRNSLLLSMLQQLLGSGGEKEPIVREAAMASLALLISYLDDTEKIPPLVDMLILCLQRMELKSDTKSKDCSVMLFLSALSFWTVKAESFVQFINPLIEHIKLVSQEINSEFLDGNKKSKIEILNSNLNCLVKGLDATIPYFLLFLYDSLPKSEDEETLSNNDNTSLSSSNILSFIDDLTLIFSSREKAENCLHLVHNFVSRNKMDEWRELNYIFCTVLPVLFESLSLLNASLKTVIVSYISVISRLCLCLGPQAKQDLVSPSFLSLLQVSEGDIESVRSGASNLTKAPLVVYIVGILSEDKPKEGAEGDLQQFLSRQISVLALSRASMQSVHLAILILVERSQCQEEILGALWSCLVHPSPLVRAATAPLWILLVGHIKESELASRVVPALVTLATDMEITVRASAVLPLAFVIANCTSKEVKDKVLLQLESVCEESQVMEQPPLQVAVAQTCSSLGHNTPSNLLHNLFLPLLCRVALEGGGTPQAKLLFGTSLLEALTALASSPMPDHLVAHFILPPLNQLQKTLGVMSFDYMETITLLTKEYTLRAQSSSSTDRIRSSLSSSGLSSIGSSLSSSMGAMGAGLPIGSGVEDVKKKMSNMFTSTGRGLQGKGPSITLPTLFKKK